MVPTPATILRQSPLLLLLRRYPLLAPTKTPSLTAAAATTRLLHPLQFPHFHTHRYLYSVPAHTFVYSTKLGFSRTVKERCSHIAVISGDSSGGGGGNVGSGGGDGGSRGGDGGAGNDGGDKSNWSLLSWYLELLAKFPVVTKAITSACLTLIGDMVCQFVVDKVQSLDYHRTFMFTFLGLVLVGPALHFWYLYLSKLVTLPGAGGAVMRLLLDQFLFAPVFIGVFLSLLVTLEGRPAEVIPKLKQEWFSSVQANWLLWIPVQFLNFRFVPQQFQVLASNFVSLLWNVILSSKAHKEVVPK